MPKNHEPTEEELQHQESLDEEFCHTQWKKAERKYYEKLGKQEKINHIKDEHSKNASNDKPSNEAAYMLYDDLHGPNGEEPKSVKKKRTRKVKDGNGSNENNTDANQSGVVQSPEE